MLINFLQESDVDEDIEVENWDTVDMVDVEEGIEVEVENGDTEVVVVLLSLVFLGEF